TERSGRRWPTGTTRTATSPKRWQGKNAMHLRNATLIAFSDGEAGASRIRQTENHLSKCERCRHELRRIQVEKEKLSVGATTLELDREQGLAGLHSAISAWQSGKTSAA